MQWNRLLIIVAAIAIALYGRFLYRHLGYAAGGPDSGGYMNEAKLIASGHVTEPVGLVRQLGLDDSWLGYFMPLGFAPSPHGSMHPLYPPGLPMHLALAGKIGGWKKAPYLVAPLAAVGCVILMILIARQLGIPLLLSFVGAAAVAWFPPLLWHAVQPASDVLAMLWALLAMVFALRVVPASPPAFAFAAGVAFSIGVWVRPTNALMVIPLAMAVRFRWRDLLRMAVGALPLVVALMVWNKTLYGSPFRTGYGDITLTWEGVLNAAPEHARWLFRMLSAAVFPCGLLVLFDRRVERWTRWMLVIWFAVFYMFYAFYGFWDGYLCLRFLLPAVPPLLFGTMLLLRDAVAAARGRVRIGAIAASVLITAWIIGSTIQYGETLGVRPLLKTVETGYPQYVRFAEKRIPQRSIVMTGVLCGAFLLYENRSIVRYDQLDDARFQLLRAYAGVHELPWYAALGHDEMQDVAALRARFRGNWEFVDKFGDVTIYRLRE
ncbi:MAG TPA: hypothetical protein VLU46_11830 [Thermoanaerobaculia bacterium]|nr:hypothetical protein [Thermoanaerobaculia bacterium]